MQVRTMSRPFARLLVLQLPLIWQGVDMQPPTPPSHPYEEHSRAVQQTVLRSRMIAGRDCAVTDSQLPFASDATAFNADEPHLIQFFGT